MTDREKEKEILGAVMKGYTTGVFDDMFAYMTDDYEHASFWVIEVVRGIEDARDYYTGKGNAIRTGGASVKGEYVRIISAPSEVRPKGVYRNGVKVKEDPVFLNRKDEGKTAVLFSQMIRGEEIKTLAVPTYDDDGKLRQLLITEPAYYGLEQTV